MKMKKIIALTAACVFLFTLFTGLFAYADTVEWKYDESTKTLYIYGSGGMTDYEDAYSAPWRLYSSEIEHFIVQDGVTSVGAYSFCGYSSLYDVQLADTVTSVNSNAFASCSKLLSLTFGSNITSISDYSFAYDGTQLKDGFSLNVQPSSYALYYAVKNEVPFSCDSVKCSDMTAAISVKGMTAYFPYTPTVDGTFTFSSESSSDPIGFIYDSDFNQLLKNDDASSSSSDFLVTYSLEKGNTYYFAAKLFSSQQTGSFKVTLNVSECTFTGSVYAMKSPDGSASDILLSNATVDSVKTDNGSFSLVMNNSVQKCTVSCDGVSKEVTFDIDDASTQTVTLMMCDADLNGIVNVKDLVLLYKSSSPYLPLFEAFLNYKTS